MVSFENIIFVIKPKCWIYLIYLFNLLTPYCHNFRFCFLAVQLLNLLIKYGNQVRADGSRVKHSTCHLIRMEFHTQSAQMWFLDECGKFKNCGCRGKFK